MTETDVYTEPTALPEIFDDMGLILDENMSFEEWSRNGQNLQRFTRSHQWWAGDWLAFGEDHFGEAHAQAFDMDLLDEYTHKTLQNYRHVSSRIPFKDRVRVLSWTHHRIAADLDKLTDRRKALKQAAAEDLSTRELQTLVDAMKPEEEPSPPSPTARMTFSLSFSIYKTEEKHGRIIADQLLALCESEIASRGMEDVKVTPSHK